MKRTTMFLLLIAFLSAVALTACGGGGGGGGDGTQSSGGGGNTGGNTPNITVTDSVAPVDDLQIPLEAMGRTSSNGTVTITNNGVVDLVIGAIGSANPLAAPYSITADNCSNQTIAQSASCTLTIRFSPIVVGVYNDSFDIPSNDPNEGSVTVSVTGTGFVEIPPL